MRVWSSSNRLLGRNFRAKLELNINDTITSDPEILVETFVNFFDTKIKKLTNLSIYDPPINLIPESDEFLCYSFENVSR